MANKDSQLMAAVIDPNVIALLINEARLKFAAEDEVFFATEDFSFPLDKKVIDLITKVINMIGDSESDYEIYKCQKQLNELWQLLIGESIKCLRFFDTREPYIYKEKDEPKYKVNKNKKPNAYGIDALAKYFHDYTEFERILYGSSKYYRDHVIHVFRTWLSGVDSLVKNDGEYIKKIFINGERGNVSLNFCEKISIWTLIALTHDLGYPLEKAKDILDTTRSMVSTFVANPNISMDLSFQGVQNYMNDFVVRLISSKIEKRNGSDPDGLYYARLQSKYYYKFQKSLERTEHGIVSTLIIYKLLTYFLESEYNINEDYHFNDEERRQFYIRREILRSIAAHTCKDVYHLYMGSFPFLLIVADDTQEWGRKYISELYVESGKTYELLDIRFHVKSDGDECNLCSISEKITLTDKHDADAIKTLIKRLRSQSIEYITLFRDGQDTVNRDFSFEKTCKIVYKCNPSIELKNILIIDNARKASFECHIDYSSVGTTNELFNKKFFENIFDEDNNVTVWWSAKKADGSNADTGKPKDWNKGIVTFSLLS